MSYTINKFKLTENGKSAMKLLPQEVREDIENGYYAYSIDDLLPMISEDKTLILEVDGDYGHYVEIWKNGKRVKTVKAETALRAYLKGLKIK